jgi:hypothetical protein
MLIIVELIAIFGGCEVRDAREHISTNCGRYRPVVVVVVVVRCATGLLLVIIDP